GIVQRPVLHDELCGGQLAQPGAFRRTIKADAAQPGPVRSGSSIGKDDVTLACFGLAEFERLTVMVRIKCYGRARCRMKDNDHVLAGKSIVQDRVLFQFTKWIDLLPLR